MKKDSLATSVGVSGLLVRTDSNEVATKAREVNSVLMGNSDHNTCQCCILIDHKCQNNSTKPPNSSKLLHGLVDV